MSILFFTKGDKTIGSSRQRVWQIAERLKRDCAFDFVVMHTIKHSIWNFGLRRRQNIRRVWAELGNKKHNIIFVHKSLFPWDVVMMILAAKVFLGKKLIYDMDDAEWVHSIVKTRLLVHIADAVFCGSHAILEWAQPRARRALLIPTVVDYEVYARFTVHATRRDLYTIGWAGVGAAHFKDGHFTVIKEALSLLWQQGIKFRFVIIGSQYYEPLKKYFSDAPFTTKFIDKLAWEDSASVPKTIQEYQFDVGLMPVSDTPFNRSKCAFKAIEYMACGIPTLSSPVGESMYLIRNGENGFLTDANKDWANILQKLLMDAELREQIGRAGQQTIQASYSLQHIVPLIEREIHAIIKS